ncbi:MAG: ABC transporter ATP-binding protein [Actinobacteria bacterium]|nr:ABC transporter ATP-binding protein [Actinomycetota bacterium]MCL5447591.1 ABC transporter ATP-binding protein [Actinomycetota bacterium]
MPAIEVKGLVKSYGNLRAVDGVDLCVEAGEVYCFLGPNGAGKTTTVEILEGYRRRDSGRVSVLGLDPESSGRTFREHIGIMLQESGLQPQLAVAEALDLYRHYYDHPRSVVELLDLVELTGSADVRIESLSGGQRRRLDLALALAGDPDLVFLDEPTTGFDPAARRGAWRTIQGLRSLGKTIFLTTHYMDEAQALADRVAVISGGKIVAEDSPDRIGGRDTTTSKIRFLLPEGVSAGDLPSLEQPAADPSLPSKGYHLDAELSIRGGAVVVHTTRPDLALHILTSWSTSRGLELAGLTVSRPTLEDVYLALTEDGP